MSQILFGGAFIRYADLRYNEGGVFCRLHFSSDLSNIIDQAMDWEPIPKCQSMAKLTGKLVGKNIVLKPNEKEMAAQAIETDCTSVEDFMVVRTKDERKAQKTELRFIVTVRAAGAIALIENYLRIVGQEPGQLKIGYAEQTKLALEQR